MAAIRPRTTAARPGTLRSTTRGPPARQDTGRMIAGLPYRPNTAASVRGNEILHLPNQWALPSASNLAEKEFLLQMVQQNGDFLQYASQQLRRDPEVVMAAVKNKGYAMKYAGPELVEDPAFMMKVVTECSRTYKYAGVKAYDFSPLEYAQSNVRKNRTIVMEAVTRQPFSLCFADPDLRDDAELVMEMVTRNGLALEHVSKRLKMNMMIVETAIKQNPDALVYAAPEVRNNPAVMPVVELAREQKALLEGPRSLAGSFAKQKIALNRGGSTR